MIGDLYDNLSSEELADCWAEDEITYRVPEHEVLLSFNNDAGAEAFNDWWFSVGKKQFVEWIISQQKEFSTK